MTTLAEAKQELNDGILKGTVCPCCGRYARINKIVITKAMALALGWLCKKSVSTIDDGWVAVQETAPKWILKSNSHAKLLHWGLLERRTASSGGPKRSGQYRPTETGRLFVDGRLRVKKATLIYNGKKVGEMGARVDIVDCLGQPFDYETMVRRAA